MLGPASLVVAALAATSALAAPALEKKSSGSFTVNVKPKSGRSAVQELARVARKYGASGNGDDFNGFFNPSAETSNAFTITVPETNIPASTTFSAFFSSPTFPGPFNATSLLPTGTNPATVFQSQSSISNAALQTVSPQPQTIQPSLQTGSPLGHSFNSSNGTAGTVAANPENADASYLSPVTIGGQKISLDFDTGSADLWVFSTELPSAESAGHTLFDTSKSPTWSPANGMNWNISYLDGTSAVGNVGFDTVTVGGVTAQKQAVEIATNVSSRFTGDTQNDGLLGLAFGSLNTIKPRPQNTWFENVMANLDKPLFTVDLNKNGGQYQFGSINSAKYTGSIGYTPINNSTGYWQFESKSYAVGGSSGSASQCTICSPAIADTGTSLMIVDDDIATAFYAKVDGANHVAGSGWTFPCSNTLPDFSVAIGDNQVLLKGSELTYSGAPESDGSASTTTCTGGIQSNLDAGGQGQQIYGDIFLKQVFAVFDYGNMRFGTASKM